MNKLKQAIVTKSFWHFVVLFICTIHYIYFVDTKPNIYYIIILMMLSIVTFIFGILAYNQLFHPDRDMSKVIDRNIGRIRRKLGLPDNCILTKRDDGTDWLIYDISNHQKITSIECGMDWGDERMVLLQVEEKNGVKNYWRIPLDKWLEPSTLQEAWFNFLFKKELSK
jgi:hypothetical protein